MEEMQLLARLKAVETVVDYLKNRLDQIERQLAASPAKVTILPGLMPSGSEAAPGVALQVDRTTGLFSAGNGHFGGRTLGLSQAGKQVIRFSYRVDAAGNDNGLVLFGRNQTTPAFDAEAYIATLAWGKVTLPNYTRARSVGANIGNWELTGQGGTTYQYRSVNIELDKLDVHVAGAGTTTFSELASLRIRSAVPDANVAITDLVGLTFVGPNGSAGTVDTYKAIEIPLHNSNPYCSTYYGIWFEGEPSGASIASRDGSNLTLTAGAGGRSASSVTITASSGGTMTTVGATNRVAAAGSGSVDLMNGGGAGTNYLARFGNHGVTSANYWQFYSNTSGSGLVELKTAGTDSNINAYLTTKGGGAWLFCTGTSNRNCQVVVNHVASAVSNINLYGAASGKNPRISASAQNLTIGSASPLAANATAGFLLIPGVGGTPSGAPNGASTGAAPIVIDTTNHLLPFYSGSAWRHLAPLYSAFDYAADAQADDTYVITLTPAPAAYVTGMRLMFKANTANTGAATINVNSLGAKTIVKRVNTTLADNDILAGMFCSIVYDGTNFVLLNPVVN